MQPFATGPLAPGRVRRPSLVLAALGALASCRALPPAARAETGFGEVRAERPEEAARIARALDRLAPRVVELLPHATRRDLDVWVQRVPRLFRFGGDAYEEADGFWAAGPERIHLREAADDLERTLAHELCHAFLDPCWERLPGTIEEGLCDVVSVRLAPRSAARMRAGRLSAAAFALGGLALDLSVTLPAPEGGPSVTLSTGLLLEGAVTPRTDPLDALRVRAGLSSTRMEPARKKALYGLALLVVERIVERRGIEGLHALCERAAREGRETVPEDWLLAAAGLPADDSEAWREAAEAALGEEELAALVALYPDVVLVGLGRSLPLESSTARRSPVSARLGTRAGTASVLLALAPPTAGEDLGVARR